jgi:hypothetical protein
LQQGRETADSAARSLAGEEMAQDMGMGMGGEQDLGPSLADDNMSDMDQGADFGASDAATGGTADLGREVR